MALESDFLTMTRDTVTVLAPASTMSEYGSVAPATTSTGTSYPAYIDMSPRKVVNARGVEEVASGTIFILSSGASLGLHHVVVLPDGRRPELLRVEPLRDDEGQHHVEVTFR